MTKVISSESLKNYSEPKPHFKKRVVWYIVNATLFRLFPCSSMRCWRNMLLRLFGARIEKGALIYSSCKIFAPWNLVVGRACVGPHTVLYNKDIIKIGDDSVVSQYSFLCTAGHDVSSLMLPLKTSPIVIEDHAWIAADCFVGMGVKIGEGAVVGARSAVFKDVEPWTIVGGNPAKCIKKREISDDDSLFY